MNGRRRTPLKPNSRMPPARVGLLTGTFDPVHLGHIELGRAALQKCGLDEVWYLVNPAPEHKDDSAGLAHRRAMVSLALEDQAGLSLYVGPSVSEAHSMATFKHIMAEHPAHQYVFIVGIDTLVRLDTWKQAQSIVDSATFAVAHRPGTSLDAIDDLKRRLGAAGERLRVLYFDFDDHSAASSTAVRRALREGRPGAGLDPRVAGYIREHGLYRRPSHSA